MKKDVIITARVTHEIKETIQSLADRDERTLAWMIRKLILEERFPGSDQFQETGRQEIPAWIWFRFFKRIFVRRLPPIKSFEGRLR